MAMGELGNPTKPVGITWPGMPPKDSGPICPVCSVHGEVCRSAAFRHSKWSTWDCRRCGLSFLWPQPTTSDLMEYYRFESFAEPTYSLSSAYGSFRISLCLQALSEIEKLRGGPGKMLDVGCSQGHMLEAALRRGWEVKGFEIDRATATKTSARLGVPVEVGDGVELLDTPDLFDLIVMSHWLEHVANPRLALVRAQKCLAEGGFIFLRIPNASSRIAKLTGSYWSWFTPPGHVTYFSPETLRTLAEGCGFTVLKLSTEDGDAMLVPFEILVSALRWTTGWQNSPGVRAKSIGTSPLASAILGRLRDFTTRLNSHPTILAAFQSGDSEIWGLIAKPGGQPGGGQ
jgi:SAM-dependent methyltransferase